MIIRNHQLHPSFFDIKLEKVQQKIKSNKLPYVNPFGYEIANLAYSIVAKKEGFSSPFGGSTGPSGWSAPGMVYIYALLFKLFGCFSKAALLSLFFLAILASVLMVLMIYSISLTLYNNQKVAALSALLFAMCPQDIWFFTQKFQQDFNAYAFLFILNFYLFIKFKTSQATPHLILFGISTGLSILFCPVLCLPASVCIIYYIFKHKDNLLDMFKNTGLFAIIVILIISPYILHQKQRLDAWTFIKSNGQFEIYQGNSPEFEGVLTIKLFDALHPAQNTEEFQEYQRLGEIAYVQSKSPLFRNNFNFIDFLKLTGKRCLYFFFIYKSYGDQNPEINYIWAIFYIAYFIPGLSMILYLLKTFNKLTHIDLLVYLYILAYAAPYLCVGIMYRYSFPICTLTTILLAKTLHSCLTQLKPQKTIVTPLQTGNK